MERDDGAVKLRGRALAKWRRAQALDLAMAGHNYDEIATRVGFANRGTAWRVVDEALSARVADNADEYRRITLARLERLIASYWEQATVLGNLRAADLVLRVVTQQAKLLGLEGMQSTSRDDVRTVVVGGTSEEYIAALKQLAGPARSTSEG